MAEHEWTILGTFELPLDRHEARRIVEAPEDIAVMWRERARIVKVHGPGCAVCGVHASEGLGTTCPGENELERRVAGIETRKRIVLPGQ